MYHLADYVVFYGLMVTQSVGALMSYFHPWHQIRGEQSGPRELDLATADDRHTALTQHAA